MKVTLGLVLAVLFIGANAQQFLTMENCVYDLGVVVADVSLYYKDKSNRQTISKLRADIQTLYDQCLSVLPQSLAAAPCDALKAQYQQAVRAQLVNAGDFLKAYHACITQRNASPQ